MGEEYPRNRREFDEMFATEEACMAYLGKLRWPDGFECQGCGSKKAWALSRRVWECTECGVQRSPTEGTLLHRTHLPLRTWFDGAWHVCEQKSGMSALGLQRALGFGSYHTAWDMFHRMRKAMANHSSKSLSGKVEVDEVFLSSRVKRENAGPDTPSKALVFIAVEVGGSSIGRVRLKAIPDASVETFAETVQQLIEPRSTVITDGVHSYEGLSSLNYRHVVSRPVTDMGKTLLPKAIRVYAQLRRWLLGTHQGAVSSERLQPYLDEFVFRFNGRNATSRGFLFHQLLQQAVRMPPIPKAALASR